MTPFQPHKKILEKLAFQLMKQVGPGLKKAPYVFILTAEDYDCLQEYYKGMGWPTCPMVYNGDPIRREG